jgi:hypothetical protein
MEANAEFHHDLFEEMPGERRRDEENAKGVTFARIMSRIFDRFAARCARP